MIKNQHTFPQRVGNLIERRIIETTGLRANNRQQTRGHYDAYDKKGVYEIKAAKDNNYFRIMQKNHELLIYAKGTYILVRYSLKNNDKDLKLISDIIFDEVKHVSAIELKVLATTWLEDQRKKNLYYKVKI